MNTALMTAQSGVTLKEARRDAEFWGRLTESAVGAYLANAAVDGTCSLYYWRERGHEVDFIVKKGRRVIAIEVKSGRAPHAHAGSDAFAAAFRPYRNLLVGGDGIPVEEFLTQPVEFWLQK